MPYHETIKSEAAYIRSLGAAAVENKLYGLYDSILAHWFTPDDGYIIEAQVLGPGGKPEYIAIHHTHHSRNPVMIVELKCPDTLRTGGKQGALADVQYYTERRFVDTCHDFIYGLAGVGLTWSVWRMDQGHVATPTNIQAWRGSITSDVSYRRFQNVFDIICQSI
jgi:hypothetical protein